MNNMYAIHTPRLDIAHNIYQLEQTSLLCTQNNLEHEDQYLCMLLRTFTNLLLRVIYLNVLRAVPDLNQQSLESIYL